MLEFLKKEFSESQWLNPFKNWQGLESPQLPMLCLFSDALILNKDETVSCVMSLAGVDYNAIPESRKQMLYQVRNSTFANNDDLVISIFHTRFQKQSDLKVSEFNNVNVQTIAQSWAGSFQSVYETQHYLMLTSKTNPIKKLRNIASDVERLEQVATYFLSAFEDFGCIRLKGSVLLQFLATLINAECFENPLQFNKQLLDEWILNTPIKMSRFDPYLHYLNTNRVSSFMTIRNYGDYAAQPVFDRLLELPVEMMVAHHFDYMEKEKALAFVADKIRFTHQFVKYADFVLQEYYELQNNLQADLIQLIQHYFTIQVISHSESQNKQDCLKIRKFLDQNGYLLGNDTLLKESLFYSQFPPKRKANKRNTKITSQNASCFVAFPSSQEGLTSCSWGSEPLTHFSSASGSIYNFCFHKDSSQSALGHTLVVGSSGSGKTTLISFLLAQATKYKGMKMLAFDQLQGLKVSTLLLGGKYLNFEQGGLSLNPFDLDKEDSGFLIDFLCDMAQVQSEQDKLKIIAGASQILDWDLSSRTVDQLLHTIAQKGEPLYEKLKQYGSTGTKSGLFSGQPVPLEADWLCFDFTHLLERPEELGLFASYLSHRFFKSCDGTPRLIFVDEFRRYLESEVFAKIAARMLQELRKLNGVFVAAVQSLDHLYLHPIGKQNLANFAKFILFPSREGLNPDAYLDGIGLNQDELAWLKNTDPKTRAVMVKTAGGSTDIVQVNLAFLKQYLHVFNSSQTHVRAIETLQKQNLSPQELMQEYLRAVV